MENNRNTEESMQKIELNQNYHGVVTKILNFGAFVKLNDQLGSGLIHISKIAKTFVRKIEDFVQVDDKVVVKVININHQKKQISLELMENMSNKHEE